jgi:glutamate-1-semialdehyde 2,1-aminomutase
MFLKKNNLSILNEGYDQYPAIDFGLGSKIYINKKKYIDLSFCSGVMLLGHQSNVFRNAFKNIVKKKISIFGSPNTYAIKFSRTLKKVIPNYSKYIFTSSGSEAIYKSIRICKALTKKNLIIACSGSWHGSSDKLLFGANKNLNPVYLSAGISKFDKNNVKFIPYNNISKSKKILEKFKNKIKCIIVEPIQGSLPVEQGVKEFLKFLENFSKKNNIILLFDEMITGLRINGLSAQKYFNIKPDISVFGKCFGGGMPIGIIALNNKIYKKIKKNKSKIFFGGTFSANSISTYIGKLTTDYIVSNRKKIFKLINSKSKFFVDNLNKFIKENKINCRVYNFKSMIRIIFSKEKINSRYERDFLEKKKSISIIKFKEFLFINKIYYPSNGLIFISYKTSKSDIKYILKYTKIGLLKYFNK